MRKFAMPLLSPRVLALSLCATVVMVVAGPFGTLEAMDVVERSLFWGAVIGLSVIVGQAAQGVSHALVGRRRPKLGDALSVLVMTLIFTPVVWLIAGLFAPDGLPSLSVFARMFFYVFVLTAAAVIVRHFLTGAPGHPPAMSPVTAEPGGRPAPEAPAPRLARRLPPGVSGPILRLSGRDHHVEVVTATGAATLRLRLRDAIAEMEPVKGYSTHRSHWVAAEAVQGSARESAQKLFLVLTNGDRVPVSRTYRPALEQAGLIDAHLPPDAALAPPAAPGRSELQPPRGA